MTLLLPPASAYGFVCLQANNGHCLHWAQNGATLRASLGPANQVLLNGTLTWDTGGTKGSAFNGFAIYVVEIERLTKNGTSVWSTAKIVLKRGWQARLDYRHAVAGKPIVVYTGPPGHLGFKQRILSGHHLPGQS